MRQFTRFSRRRWSLPLAWCAAIACQLVAASLLLAQQGPIHYFHSGNLPPGVVGQGQAMRGGPTPGYFQPVEVRGPQGTLISAAVNGEFTEGKSESLLTGMLIGQVYRFKVARIPGFETDEVYPTVEVVSRLHPPPGQALRFPIPIELTQQEIELAITGRFVTRVIYLEDPYRALPVKQEPQDPQRYFEAPPAGDALRIADELGRPMAILRMGSRIPDPQRETTNLGFGYGHPPLLLFERPAPLQRNAGLEPPYTGTPRGQLAVPPRRVPLRQ
ncbi:MAG: hypothetical protein U1A77_05650 [Pirellulales bacterium]